MDNDHNITPDHEAPPGLAPAQPPSGLTAPLPAVVPTPPAPFTPLPHLPEDAEPHQPALSEASADVPALPHPAPSRRPVFRAVLVGFIALVVLAAIGVGAFQLGNNRGYARGKRATPQMSAMASTLKVPVDATVVAQCTPGEGKQYISPKDIPMGPIYNVWNNAVIGLEYMLPESDIDSNKGLDLSAMGQQYDHVDIVYEASGHAGLKEPHYHILLSTVANSVEKQITCGGPSTEVHTMNMGM